MSFMYQPQNRSFENQRLSWQGPTQRSSYGPFGGNGSLGANLWFDGSSCNIALDHAHVWDLRMEGRPWDHVSFDTICAAIAEGDHGRVQEMTEQFHGEGVRNPFNLNMAKLNIEMAAEKSLGPCDEYMDFGRGEFGATFNSAEQGVELRAWVARTQDRVWVTIRALDSPTSFRLKLERTVFEPKLEEALDYESPTRLPDIGFTQTLHDKMSYGLRLLDDRGTPLEDEAISIAAGESVTFCIQIAHDSSTDDVLKQLNTLDCTYLHDRAEHLKWWKSFWSKSEVNLDEQSLNAIWYTGLYTLACCAGETSPPVTLQGLWTEDGAPGTWGGHIFSNLNTQISYWACCGANHPELLRPLVEFLLDDAIMQTMEQETEAFYGLPGIAVPVATDLQGRRLYSWLPVQIWPSAGAWLCQAIWDYARSTNDREALGRAYRLFVKVEAFMTAYAHRDSKDQVDFAPSHSPELNDLTPEHMWLSMPTMDLWIYKSLLRMCVDASLRLDCDPDKRKEWELREEQLPEYPQQESVKWHDGSDRFEDSKVIRFLTEGERGATELSHRHLSHCAPIYPGADVNIEGPQKDLALHSIQHNIRRGTGLWIGYSFVWQACLAARCRMPAMARHHIQTYWDHFTSSSGFHANGETSGVGISDFNREYYAHLPMSIEATLAAPAAIQEMLLQSWGGSIRVFPALPARQSASFSNLRTEDGCLVSASVDTSERVSVEIEAPELSEQVRIQVEGPWELLVGELIEEGSNRIVVRAVGAQIRLQYQR